MSYELLSFVSPQITGNSTICVTTFSCLHQRKHHTGPLWRNPPYTSGFPSQRACKAGKCFHVMESSCLFVACLDNQLTLVNHQLKVNVIDMALMQYVLDFIFRLIHDYCQTSNIRGTFEYNKIVDHSDVVGPLPLGAAPTTSSFST